MQVQQSHTFETRDEFGRKPIAEKLINLISQNVDISPMVIDGDWGVGKTEFCQKLINLIEEQKPDEYQTVYIDAFRSDHNNEPLVAILAEIIKKFSLNDGGQENNKRSLIKRFASVMTFSTSTILKATAGHVFKQNADLLLEDLSHAWSEEDKKEIAETVSKTATELSDKMIDSSIDLIAEKLLREQIELEKNMLALKEILSDLSAEKPIILFIDELDRCRPDYAVQMLEILKHVFDIENVKIILITNMQQLQASVNHRYGSLVQAERYLNKFIKFSFKLPNLVDDWHGYGSNSRTASSEYFYTLINETNVERMINATLDNAILNRLIVALIDKNNLSLREVETFVRYLDIYFVLKKENAGRIYLGYRLLEVFAVFIFCFRPQFLDSILKEELNISDLAKSIGFKNSLVLDMENTKDYAINLIISMLRNESKYGIKEIEFKNPSDIAYWDGRVEQCFDFHSTPDNYLNLVKNVIYELQFKRRR